MKMNLFDKFLLALVLLLLLALSVFVGCMAVSLVPVSAVTGFLDSLVGYWAVNGYIFGAVALVLFVIVIRLFAASYGGDRSQAYTRLTATENGEIAISIPTIKQITAAFVANNPDVTASSSEVLSTKAGLVVRLQVCVKEGALLPDVTSGIQKDLKAHLETITGLAIRQIGVYVDNNRSNYAGKVR